MTNKTVILLLLVLVALVQPVSATATLLDGVVEFDSETNLADLLTSVGNVSQLSESGGLYTMHVPFNQNSSVNTFYINDGEVLHLKSLPDDVVYVTFENVSIDGGIVGGPEERSDEYEERAYLHIHWFEKLINWIKSFI